MRLRIPATHPLSHIFHHFTVEQRSVGKNSIRPSQNYSLWFVFSDFRICKLEGNQSVNFYFASHENWSSLTGKMYPLMSFRKRFSQLPRKLVAMAARTITQTKKKMREKRKIAAMEIHVPVFRIHLLLCAHICVQVWILGHWRVCEFFLNSWISSLGYFINCSFPCPTFCCLSSIVCCFVKSLDTHRITESFAKYFLFRSV